MINVYQEGDIARISGVFKNAAGAATDPTTVSFKYINPSGTVVTLVYLTDAALVRSSAGDFYVDININEPGTWFYRFIGTGAVQVVEEGQFGVEASGL